MSMFRRHPVTVPNSAASSRISNTVPFQVDQTKQSDEIHSRQMGNIPFGPHSRNLVLIFDGTSNQFGPDLTSMPVLYGLLQANTNEQLLYYQSGIGTYVPVYSPTGIIRAISELADAAVAWNLNEHVQDGYQFLSNHYQPGDRIYLFGFSRGAFTARALAGMIQQVGLLLPGNEESIPFAYKIYAEGVSAELYPGESLSSGFKRTFARDVRIHFIGVDDTVSSVGAIIPRTLPFSGGSSFVTHFRQCLSLDERRIRFSPQPWIPDLTPVPSSVPDAATQSRTFSVKEVWFCGAHSDVGGGQFPTDGDVKPRLSHLPLRWLIRESMEQGLQYDISALEASNIFTPFIPAAEAMLAEAENKDEEVAAIAATFEAYFESYNFGRTDKALVAIVWLSTRLNETSLKDSCAPRGDALSFRIQHDTNLKGLGANFKAFFHRIFQRTKTALWWVLECIPMLRIVWNVQGQTRSTQWSSNFGRGRTLTPNPVFHWSVRERLNATPSDFSGQGNNQNVPETKYKFKAKFFGKNQSLESVKWENG